MKLIMKFLLRFLQSTGFLYLLVGLVIWGTVNVHRVEMARLGSLDIWSDYPVRFIEKRSPYDERQFRYAKKYYQALARIIPLYEKKGITDKDIALSRAYALIAFCYHYLGNDRAALENYKRTASIGPDEIWLNYDLGVVSFNLGEYEQALSYLKNNFAMNDKKLSESMDRDYYQNWDLKASKNYKEFSTNQFYKLTMNSYKLGVLAYERMGDMKRARALAVVAIQIGMAKNNIFFLYYAGVSSQKLDMDEDLMKLAVNPSLFYVALGQEKIFNLKLPK